MSRADLHPGISTHWNPILREWLVRVPSEVLEREGVQVKHGEAHLARMIVEDLAKPGPVTRAVRAQVKRNNLRRFGP